MSNLTNQYNNEMVEGQGNGGSNAIAKSQMGREAQEVQAQVFMAKQFPRNVFDAERRIMDNCKRKSLAEVAVYKYPRGGSSVEGPSVRLAEVLAQNWGNLSFGVKELEQRNGESLAMAYAWDLETNVRQEKIFTVPHVRHTKKGVQKLNDPRDIYELVANNGARRMRACILGVIPGDIVDNAVEQCHKTLTGDDETPLKDKIARMLSSFKEKFGVTQEQIEERAGYNVSAFTVYDLKNFVSIYNSIKDGMSKPEDWFEKPGSKEQGKLANKMKDAEAPKKADKKPEGEKVAAKEEEGKPEGKAVEADADNQGKLL